MEKKKRKHKKRTPENWINMQKLDGTEGDDHIYMTS